jgi:hypothetical protein
MSQMGMQLEHHSPLTSVVVAESAIPLAPSARYRFPPAISTGLLTPLAGSGSPSQSHRWEASGAPRPTPPPGRTHYHFSKGDSL